MKCTRAIHAAISDLRREAFNAGLERAAECVEREFAGRSQEGEKSMMTRRNMLRSLSRGTDPVAVSVRKWRLLSKVHTKPKIHNYDATTCALCEWFITRRNGGCSACPLGTINLVMGSRAECDKGDTLWLQVAAARDAKVFRARATKMADVLSVLHGVRRA